MIDCDAKCDIDAPGALGDLSPYEDEEAPPFPPPQLQHNTTKADLPVGEVMRNPDLLERVLSFLPTPADLGRCTVVNKAFRAAASAAGRAVLARTFPAAVALEGSGVICLNRDGLGLRIAKALAAPSQAEPQMPAFPLDAYEVHVELRSPRRGNAPVFACNGRFTADDADLPLQCDNTLTSPLDPAVDFDGFHFRGEPSNGHHDQDSDLEADLDQDEDWNSADSDYCSDCGGGSRYKYTVFGDAPFEVDITLVRLSDGAVCNFVHNARAFHQPPSDFDTSSRMHVRDLVTSAHGIVISPWTPHDSDPMLHDKLGMELKFSVRWKKTHSKKPSFTGVLISPCVYVNNFLDGDNNTRYRLDANGAAHAFGIADLQWTGPAGADHAELLQRARTVSPAAVTGDDVPAKIWPQTRPPSSLDDYCAMIQVRDHERAAENQMCFSSSGILTEDLTGFHHDSGGQIFDNTVRLPDADSTAWDDGSDEDDVRLNIILVRRSDGAVYNMAHRYIMDNAFDGGVSFGPNREFEDEPPLTPWIQLLHTNGGTLDLETRLRCNCFMWSEGNGDTARWKHICMVMYGIRSDGEEQDLYFENAHYLAHALAMLPWKLR